MDEVLFRARGIKGPFFRKGCYKAHFVINIFSIKIAHPLGKSPTFGHFFEKLYFKRHFLQKRCHLFLEKVHLRYLFPEEV